jgi:hypothetical protein
MDKDLEDKIKKIDEKLNVCIIMLFGIIILVCEVRLFN